MIGHYLHCQKNVYRIKHLQLQVFFVIIFIDCRIKGVDNYGF